MKDLLIKIEKLTKKYTSSIQAVDVIRGLDLEVKKGEFIIIFGPSGSGKSTLLNLILGLEKRTSGSITFLGRRIDLSSETELALFRKNNIGIVYQQPYWIKSLDLIGNVAFPLSIQGVKKEIAYNKAIEALTRVGMEKWGAFYPTELSSGQQQKVSLARAIITDPEIIIADEPTGNLDYNSGQDVTKYLHELNKEGKTIIMVTHNLDNLDTGERILHILDGRIVEDFELKEENIKKIKADLIDKDKIQKLASERIQPQRNIRNELPQNNIILEKASFFEVLKEIFLISILSTITLLNRLIYLILSIKFLPNFINTFRFKLSNSINKVINILDKNEKNNISYTDLFDISIKNLFLKRKRSFVAILGVALGIAFTVILISLGYGLETLIIERSASITQLKQMEVFPAIGESIKLNDETIQTIKGLNNVTEVLPLIGNAGKVDYNESNLDVVIYGIQTSYLQNSDSTLLAGEYLSSNNLYLNKDEKKELDTILNKQLVDLLGIQPRDAIGKTIRLGYEVSNNNSDSVSDLIFTEYTIKGVIDSDNVPLVYIPIENIRDSKVTDYSQVKVITNNQNSVPELRTKINALGFRTTSVLDTISQIESLFSTLRLVFGVIGLISLFIASLGMFNTLTVSLLERVREVGLMKVMGVNEREIRRLFLSEAITMGLLGGTLGILVGIIISFILTSLVSILSLIQGGIFVNIFNLPLAIGALIILLSAFTGILTGFYPARRATNVPALDALRYE